jgi:signal transduction histidine kinase
MPPRRGIGGRLGRAFLVQGAFISVATLVGVLAAGWLLEGLLIRQALRDEAGHFWASRAAQPDFQLPSTRNLTGYMDDVPAPLETLGLGYHPWQKGGVEFLVYVTERQGQRLYLAFDRSGVGRLATYYGLVPLAIVLLVLYLSTWLGYRASQRALSPVIALAREVRQLDPKAPDPAAFSAERVPRRGDDEIRELADALAWFAQRLNELVERERNFTRDASHELRSPLTVIRTSAEILLQDATLGDSARRGAERISRAARDMEELTTSFLLLARESESGLPVERVSVNEVVATELDRVRPLAEGRPVELKLQADCLLVVEAPEKVLSVMLGNLLRNAVAYTEQGIVRVTISAQGIEIEDTGVGLPPERVRDLRRPFLRGTHRHPGHGVGLTIVHRLSDRFGWPVTIDSEPGRGTRVSAQFPTATTAAVER